MLDFPVRGAEVTCRGDQSTSVVTTDNQGYYVCSILVGDTVNFGASTFVGGRTWGNSTSAFMDGEGSDSTTCEPIPTIKIDVCRIAGAINVQNVNSMTEEEVNNPEIIEKGLQIPINQKFNQKTKKGKLILRKIADRYKIPYLDDKQGFSPGLIEDWFNNGRDICQNILKDKKSYIYSKKIIDFNWVIKAMEKIDNDGDIRYLHRITSILALEIWFKVSVYKDVKTSQKL